MNVTEITINSKEDIKIVRLAAYCRVSSDSADQLHSFAAQIRYYKDYERKHPEYKLVDIYADEGLTGTNTSKRDDFNRLIADCKKGKIDRVLTKSVSRFARNTADSLMYARLLKEYGVSILFEKENIDTAYMSSELLLALSGAQAQEESISISKNMRWSIERRMKAGTFIASHTAYGYKLVDGEYVIEKKEAEIVKLIFESFLSGMGKKAIADMLNEMNAPKRKDVTSWRIATIEYILTNERYIGDALFQKTFKTETVPFIQKTNRGEKTRYYVENTNTPIISRADFEMVQKLIKDNSLENQRKKAITYPLTQKIRCKCGSTYKPLTVNGKKYWECTKHNLGRSKCDSRRRLFHNTDSRLKNSEKWFCKNEDCQFSVYMTVAELEHEITKILNLLISNPKFTEYEETDIQAEPSLEIIRMKNEIERQLESIDFNKNKIQNMILQCAAKKYDAYKGVRHITDRLKADFEKSSPLSAFNTRLFDRTVSAITIDKDKKVYLKLKNNKIIRKEIPLNDANTACTEIGQNHTA